MDDPILSVLVFLAGGLLAMALSARTGLNFLLALILVGILVGPQALGWAAHGRSIELLAELGVAFLLFDIGLHLSARTLWAARRYLLAFAPLQILLCAAALGLLLRLLFPALAALGWWLPAALSLSSTAVVLQLLRESGEEQTPIGRASLAALLAQDLFVVLLLVVLPSLAGSGTVLETLPAALGKLAGALLLAVVAGRLLLAGILGWTARQRRPEAFTGAALLCVLSIAWLTHAFGLSIALGAFLAGTALAESRYAQLVQAEVAPFRGLLLSLFFLSVGMSLEIDAIVSNAALVAALTGAMLLVKALATLLAARLIGKGWGAALRLGLTLAQGSEFAFVVLAVAARNGLIPAELGAPIGAAVVLSIAATPPLVALGRGWAARLERSAPPEPARVPAHRVVLIGFDATMEAVARALDRAGVDFVAFTSDRERAARGRCLGFDLQFADRDRPKGLAFVAAGEAAAVIVGVDDDAHGLRLVTELATLSPDLAIYGVAGDLEVLHRMEQAGARQAVRRTETAAGALVETLLTHLQLPRRDVEEGVAECGERREEVVGGAVAV